MSQLLSDDQLIVEVRRLAALNQRLPVLLLLAHVTQPAKTRVVIDKGIDIGFRKIKDWNVTDILKGADSANQVAQGVAGWLLLDRVWSHSTSGVYLQARRAATPSDSVLRGYIEKVVTQINGAYDHGFYDCCAVQVP